MNIRMCLAWVLILLPTVCSYSVAQKTDVGAIGRITPKNGVIQVICPAGDIIDTLEVQVGDKVARGDIMISLRTDENARLNLEAARSAVREAKELGPMALALQQLKKKAAAEDYAFAQKRFERFKEIGGESISIQQMEEREYQVQSSATALELAEKDLARTEREQRRQLEHAEHELKVAEQAMKRFVVRAPIDGVVLEIFKNAGDRTDGSPVMRVADLREMMVVAEVFEGDVKKLSTGMKASVTSNALTGKLTGRVLSISPVIERETKIAHVNIVLDNPKEASRFIDMETNIVIYCK